MASEKTIPEAPKAAAPSSAAVDVKAAVNEVRQTNLAAENEALKQQLATLKKQASAPKPAAPKAPFDLVGALKTVNPEYLTFLEKELATSQSPETKFQELAKQLPHFFRAKDVQASLPVQQAVGLAPSLQHESVTVDNSPEARARRFLAKVGEVYGTKSIDEQRALNQTLQSHLTFLKGNDSIRNYVSNFGTLKTMVRSLAPGTLKSLK